MRHTSLMGTSVSRYHRHRFPTEIISCVSRIVSTSLLTSLLAVAKRGHRVIALTDGSFLHVACV
jgi:hypothetical protein